MVKDLTNGKPIRVMFMFVLPMLLSIVFQQMYNLADSVIAGKFAGEDALAAVGASYPITMIFMGDSLRLFDRLFCSHSETFRRKGSCQAENCRLDDGHRRRSAVRAAHRCGVVDLQASFEGGRHS